MHVWTNETKYKHTHTMLRVVQIQRVKGIVSSRWLAPHACNFQFARLLSNSTNVLPQQVHNVEQSASAHSQARNLLLPVVKRLEITLKSKGRADADSLLSDLKRLHNMNAAIPLSIFVDAAEILCNRQDATRAELLIHLCRDNLRLNDSAIDQLEEKSTQSRPKDDALNKLVSHAISGLFRHGSIDDASKFWVRMSSSGYVTNRFAMEKMLDRLVGDGDSAPSLQLIESLHVAMKTHLWHQSPQYYVRILKVLRQHLQRCCESQAALDAAVLKLDSLWAEASTDISLTPSLPLEMHALRVHCLTSAMQARRLHAATEEDRAGGAQGGDRYRDRALLAFSELLESADRHQAGAETAGTGTGTGPAPLDDATLIDIAHEVRSILSSYLAADAASGDSPHSPGSAVDSEAAHNAVGMEARSERSVDPYSNKYSAVGDTRRAISLLLSELAGQGQVQEAQVLLSHYLQTHSSVSPAAEVSARTAPLSFLDRDGPKYFVDLNSKIEAKGAQGVREAITAVLSSRALLGVGAGLRVVDGLGLGLGLGLGAGQSQQQLKAAQQYSAEEKAWQADLVCEILRSTNVSRRVLEKAASKGSRAAATAVDFAVFKELEGVFYSLKEVLHSYQLKPGAKFVASFIDALSVNTQFVAQHAHREGGASISWTASLAAARLLLDNLDEKTRRSTEVTHSLVKLLCEGSRAPEPDASAVLRALQMVQEMGNDKVRLLPSTLSVLLEAATSSLDDALLGRLLSQLEEVLHTHCTQHGEEAKSQATEQLLKARIYAHCRLREGYRALQLLRVLRTSEGKAPLSMYSWLVNALHQSVPYSSGSRTVARSPSSTVNFIVQEMKRDGHVLNADMVALLLRLFTKAAQVADSPAQQLEIIAQMNEFVEKCCPIGGKASSATQVNEAVLRELVKAHCVSGLAQEAMKLIQEAKAVHGVMPSAVMYEPIIYQCAVLGGDLNKAEDILNTLVNQSIPLTDAIVTSFVQGLMRHGELSEALDCIQDMYNQHRVRPTVSTWTALLDASLGRGDVLEARRVVYLLSQLYTERERQTLVGPAVHLSKGMISAEVPLSTEDSPASAATVDVRRQEAVAAYWSPKTQKEGGKKQQKPSAAQGMPSRQMKLGVPLGQRQKGVLGDGALADRFAQYGLILK